MNLRFDSTERRVKVFLLYERVTARERRIVLARGGRSAIAVSDDPLAKEWQQIQMRLEVMRAYLSGRQEVNWFHAHWLSLDEARKRMGIQ